MAHLEAVAPWALDKVSVDTFFLSVFDSGTNYARELFQDFGGSVGGPSNAVTNKIGLHPVINLQYINKTIFDILRHNNLLILNQVIIMKLIIFLVLILYNSQVLADANLVNKEINCDDKICNVTYNIPDTYNNEILIINDNINTENVDDINIILNNLSNNVYTLKSFNDNLVTRVYRNSNNEALMYLYEGIPLTIYELSDELLDKKLRIYGYSGIEELELYYIDYFNKNYQEDFTSFDQLIEKYFDKLWPNNIDDNIKVVESNKNIIKSFNNYFKKNNNDNNKLFPKTVTKYELNTNLENKYYFNLEFSKDDNYGIVKVHCLDTLGNYLTNVNVLNGLIGNSFEIKENEFTNYYLKEIKGSAVGEFKNEIQDVYLVYDLISDEKLVFNEDDNYVNTGIKKANFLPYNLVIFIILLILWWQNEKKDY